MAKRGRILSDPTAGPGRVMVQGRQHVFGLDGVWRSDALPRPGVVVDVEFDQSGRVCSMDAVPEARLAREQVQAALASVMGKGAAVGAGIATRFGPIQLAVIVLLVAGWFLLVALLPLAFVLIVVLQGIELVRPVSAYVVSLGAGAYLAALVSALFALVYLKRFLVAKARDEAVYDENE